MTNPSRRVVVNAIVFGVLSPVFAQVPAVRPEPAFEVASVRRNTSGNPGSRINVSQSRLIATNVSLRQLIMEAYRLQSFEIVDGPDWLGGARGPKRSGDTLFDVIAAIPSGTGPAQVPVMLKMLLADRFDLAVHTETRQLPMFALVRVHGEARLGPQLVPSSQNCTAVATGGPLRAPATRVATDGTPVCGMTVSPARMRGGGITMAQLASSLSVFTQRIVADRSDLEGFFDFDLRYSAEGRGAPPLDSAQGDVPSIFTAVQEQLGLKLQATSGAAEVLVINRASLPADD